MKRKFSDIPASVLKHYGYDSSSFTEADLPRRMSKPDHKYAENRRSMLFVLQDIDASKGGPAENTYKYRDKQSQLNSLEILFELHGLKAATQDGKIEGCDPENLRTALQTSFYSHQKPRQKGKLASELMWKTGTEHVESAWVDYLEATCEWLSHPRGSVEPSEPGQSIYEDLSSGYPDSVPGSRSPTQISETINAQMRVRTSTGLRLATSPATDEHHNADNLVANSRSLQKQIRAATETLMSDELSVFDVDNQARNSCSQMEVQFDGEIPIEVSKKRKLNGFRFHPTIVPVRSGPYARLESDSEKERNSVRNEVRTLFEDLHHRQQNAIGDVFKRIGLDWVHYSPCVRDPPECLAKLFARCLGNDWVIAEGLMRRKGWLSALDTATALLSAFLYNELYSSPPPWLQDFDRGASIFEDELREYCDTSGKIVICLVRFDCLLTLKPGIRLERLKKIKIFKYASSDTFRRQHLREHAKKLVDDFVSCFEPYAAVLSDQASRMTRHLNQTEWQTHFETELQSIFEDALVAQTRMAASSSDFEFFWPAHGDAVDFKYMSAPYAKGHEKDADLIVAFARRPGLAHKYSVGQDAR